MANPKLIREFDIQYADDDDPLQTLDLWYFDSPCPTPLVIYFHGGGFRAGDKDKVRKDAEMMGELRRFLQLGVAFASVNYRFRSQKDQAGKAIGAYGSMCDCRLALQFLRSKAEAYNIDKGRIGAYGDSAGGGTALWLAFHDEMGNTTDDEGNPIVSEVVSEQSTRLSVVGARSVQATYNFRKWPDILHVDRKVVGINQREQDFWFPTDDADQGKVVGKIPVPGKTRPTDTQRAEVDMWAQVSADDPPMYISNLAIDSLESEEEVAHHPLHAVALWEKAKEARIEARVYAPNMGLTAPCENLVDFFLWHLLEYPDLCFCQHAGSADDASSEEAKPGLLPHLPTRSQPV